MIKLKKSITGFIRKINRISELMANAICDDTRYKKTKNIIRFFISFILMTKLFYFIWNSLILLILPIQQITISTAAVSNIVFMIAIKVVDTLNRLFYGDTQNPC